MCVSVCVSGCVYHARSSSAPRTLHRSTHSLAHSLTHTLPLAGQALRSLGKRLTADDVESLKTKVEAGGGRVLREDFDGYVAQAEGMQKTLLEVEGAFRIFEKESEMKSAGPPDTVDKRVLRHALVSLGDKLSKEEVRVLRVLRVLHVRVLHVRGRVCECVCAYVYVCVCVYMLNTGGGFPGVVRQGPKCKKSTLARRNINKGGS